MTNFIFIRHGDLIRDKAGYPLKDELTTKANEIAKRLEDILKKNNYPKIDKIYFDKSRKTSPSDNRIRPIKRCENTIKHISGDKESFDLGSLPKLCENLKKYDCVIICYQSESLSKYSCFDELDIENILKSKSFDLNIKSKDKALDFLYENMFVIEYNNNNYKFKEWINTETYKGHS